MSQGLVIDSGLVASLVESQFPEFAQLPITPVKLSGWDNRTFHLGESMLTRLPSGEHYARAVQKEQTWLPQLASKLPLPIPEPIAHGQPDQNYPWEWSIYRWLEGEIATRDSIKDLNRFAKDLAEFLLALQNIDSTGGPTRTLRGGSLKLYEPQMQEALNAFSGHAQIEAARDIWELAISEPIDETPVWYHGDVAAGNLLVVDGQLSSVIDFGGLGVGDPACDMVIAWTFLDPPSRQVFKDTLDVSDAVWNRGRGWALWKAMIVLAGIIETNAIEAASSQYAFDQVIADFKLMNSELYLRVT